MGLTEKEKTGASKIIHMLSDEELLSLAVTVTKDQLRFSSLREAARAVLAYTEAPDELLRRKKIRRELLFQYAHEEGIRVMPADDKLTLIRCIMSHWGSQNVPNTYLEIDNEIPGRQLPPAYVPNAIGSSVVQTQQRGSPTMPDLVDATPDFNYWNDGSLRGTEEDQMMAVQFSQWFYPRMNASTLMPNDLFRDAFLQLCVVNGGNRSIERFEGSELAVGRLVAFVSQERLIFNPNSTPDGVRGMSDPHGRRVIFICGTVHRADTVVGLFEQQFGLVRDPTAENNWKIRSTRLALSTTAPSSLPTLAITQAMLTAS